jgi:hypothetical protein
VRLSLYSRKNFTQNRNESEADIKRRPKPKITRELREVTAEAAREVVKHVGGQARI